MRYFFQEYQSNCRNGSSDKSGGGNGSQNGSLVGMAKLSKDNVEAEPEVLTTIDKKFKDINGDPGPVYDVVLFKDDQDMWTCIIDTTEQGNLTDGGQA